MAMGNDKLQITNVKFNAEGLVPVIAQDYKDGAVLMLAYMNKESLQKTLETREMWYWSRSRKTLWHKGDTSGHIQKVKELYYDCDADALLAKIEQVGNIACHTGNRSCFFNKII
jgi:phosphoribosyl-AMP cyclohydrolase/phosphoribosyl-ATP pyrophosphohydrolase/phosphoribosyl-AMP cyclohydrolase